MQIGSRARVPWMRPRVVARSDKMREVLRQVEVLAPFDDVPVLIGGESGTGKELVARLLHHQSPRASRSFVAVNAAAVPDGLLEAELFGHTRGAFTGASEPRKGLLDEADGGTLFLDEVADLSPRAQTVLLRAIQEREYRRVGETSSRRSDFRLLTATHKSLEAEVARGRFRQDLLFRLDVARIELPPLRVRPTDVAPLVDYFLEVRSRALSISRPRLSPEAEALLMAHSWPGNVRELQNELTQALVRAVGEGEIRPEHLSMHRRCPSSTRGLRTASQAFERNLLTETLARHGGNRTMAARSLGISRQGLYRKLKRHGIALKALRGADAPGGFDPRRV
jgi:transcriptional regulator with PAS, ATPase and Fis domain